MKDLLLTIIKTGALAGIVYFSAALALQINLGGDVEYWISLLIVGNILVYSFIDWRQNNY